VAKSNFMKQLQARRAVAIAHDVVAPFEDDSTHPKNGWVDAQQHLFASGKQLLANGIEVWIAAVTCAYLRREYPQTADAILTTLEKEGFCISDEGVPLLPKEDIRQVEANYARFANIPLITLFPKRYFKHIDNIHIDNICVVSRHDLQHYLELLPNQHSTIKPPIIGAVALTIATMDIGDCPFEFTTQFALSTSIPMVVPWNCTIIDDIEPAEATDPGLEVVAEPAQNVLPSNLPGIEQSNGTPETILNNLLIAFRFLSIYPDGNFTLSPSTPDQGFDQPFGVFFSSVLPISIASYSEVNRGKVDHTDALPSATGGIPHKTPLTAPNKLSADLVSSPLSLAYKSGADHRVMVASIRSEVTQFLAQSITLSFSETQDTPSLALDFLAQPVIDFLKQPLTIVWSDDESLRFSDIVFPSTQTEPKHSSIPTAPLSVSSVQLHTSELTDNLWYSASAAYDTGSPRVRQGILLFRSVASYFPNIDVKEEGIDLYTSVLTDKLQYLASAAYDTGSPRVIQGIRLFRSVASNIDVKEGIRLFQEASSYSLNIDVKGGHQVIPVYERDGLIIINNFGGVGQGIAQDLFIREEFDTFQFIGEGFRAKTMLLTQEGNDLRITFEGRANPQILLRNFALENLDNLPAANGNSIPLINILFNEEAPGQDRFDVFNADWIRNTLLNRNTVTFQNDLDNFVFGFDDSDDVINGQGGNDRLFGLGGNDILRGGAGNDVLSGGLGVNSLTGNQGRDTFVISVHGFSQVNDFKLGEDLIGLPNGVVDKQITIEQKTLLNSSSTWIKYNNTVVMELNGVKAIDLTTDIFYSPSYFSPLYQERTAI
jgi:RTX calcium-binding nonapeptide repeat (4 copies)